MSIPEKNVGLEKGCVQNCREIEIIENMKPCSRNNREMLVIRG